MKYRPQNDLIDPDVPAFNGIDAPAGTEDPDSGNDAYVFDEHGNTVRAREGGPARKEAKGKREWVMPTAILLVVICIGLTVWNVTRLTSGGPPPPNPSPFQVKQGLYLGVMKVEAYRKVHGVTPDGLQDVGLSSPPYRYTRVSPTEYAIGLDAYGQKIDFNSRMSMQSFFGSPKQILAMGGAQ